MNCGGGAMQFEEVEHWVVSSERTDEWTCGLAGPRLEAGEFRTRVPELHDLKRL
jgi:hypothetical protein